MSSNYFFDWVTPSSSASTVSVCTTGAASRGCVCARHEEAPHHWCWITCTRRPHMRAVAIAPWVIRCRPLGGRDLLDRLLAQAAPPRPSTDANELVADIHDRMPVILAPGHYVRWLGDEPDPRELMRCGRSRPRVNRPRERRAFDRRTNRGGHGRGVNDAGRGIWPGSNHAALA